MLQTGENMSEKETKQNIIRVYAKVTDEMNLQLDTWSSKLGITKSQLVNMSIMAGLGTIIRAINPESFFTPEMIAAISKAATSEEKPSA